jgi:GT2 family glycosyltransferase
MGKKVAIIISTCNQSKLVEKCLVSIKKKTNYKNYKVYLIDDSGNGEIGKEIEKKFKWVNISINKINIGIAKSINLGIKKSIKEYSPDYILHLDDDIEIVEKDWLKKMVSVGNSDKKIGILGCKLIFPEGNLQWFFKNGKMHLVRTKKDILETKETFQIKDVELIIGACFLIRKKVIDEIGLYDEKFSPEGGEETDFCYRAIKKGFRMVYVGNTKVSHYGSASEKKHEQNKGRWFFFKKHGIRLEWLNFNIPKIIKYTIIHFGSAILSKNPFKKLKLLLEAYKENLDNLKEIKQKRKERFSWKK